MQCRNRLYENGWKESYQAPVPVVSIGNLTLGGTGKTPCVEYAARLYRQHDLRVAILSRGYASCRGRNDEALVLEENLPDVPHLQGPDRGALARAAVAELESEVLVLDDGFQHRRLRRDLDVVLIDATNPWGFGYLFPRGLLREPLGGLRRAGVIVLTRCNQVESEVRSEIRAAVTRLAPDVPVAEAVHLPSELINSEQGCAGLELLSERPVAAFCGVGNPEAFRRTLLDLTADLHDFRIFPDHYPYERVDVEDLRAWAGQQVMNCLIVTTQKDLVKLRLTKLGSRPLWALRICLQVQEGREMFDHKLMGVVGAQCRGQSS